MTIGSRISSSLHIKVSISGEMAPSDPLLYSKMHLITQTALRDNPQAAVLLRAMCIGVLDTGTFMVLGVSIVSKAQMAKRGPTELEYPYSGKPCIGFGHKYGKVRYEYFQSVSSVSSVLSLLSALLFVLSVVVVVSAVIVLNLM